MAVSCELFDEDTDCKGLEIGEPCGIPSDLNVSQIDLRCPMKNNYVEWYLRTVGIDILQRTACWP